MHDKYSLYIGGQWVKTENTMDVVDKYTGERFAVVCTASAAEVVAAVGEAAKSFKTTRITSFERYKVLARTSELLSENVEDLALTIAREGGKVLKDARTEVLRASQVFLLAAEEAKRICGEMIPIEATPGAENRLAYTIRVPVGVVCAISPFNFPINLTVHKVAAALAAGNSVVLKPASATPVSAVKLCQILEQAGLPAGYINLVIGSGSEVGDLLLRDERVNFYTFTGSPAVGRKIMATIGLRKSTMELGSNSATIVHHDADLTRAAALCARSSFANAGQVCISVQRILVHHAIYAEFCAAMIKETKKLVVGNPLDPETDVGPMISESEAVRAETWVKAAVAGGAQILSGGRRHGSLFEPTILVDVKPDMQVVCEEVFAPIVSLLPYQDIEEAIEQANTSKYGLQAGIFTASIDIAAKAAQQLEVGGVIINDTSNYRADLVPYGGVKKSGIGREGPKYAIQEMTEPRLVVFNL